MYISLMSGGAHKQVNIGKVRSIFVPEEVWREIFRQLQGAYNDYRRYNALAGIVDPPSDTKVWDPVALQLVCRRWKELAQPMYYREQVALSCDGDDRTFQLLRTLGDNPKTPYPRRFVLMVSDVRSFRVAQLRIAGHGRRSETEPLAPPLQIVASVPCFETTTQAALIGNQLSHCTSCVISVRGDVITKRAVCGLLLPLRAQWLVELNEDGRRVEPHVVTLRLVKAAHLNLAVGWIVEILDDLAYLPHLRLEAPFALPRDFLDGDGLGSLLQHQSNVGARDALWAKDETLKTFSFGVASTTDASALLGKIAALSGVDVIVKVDVLGM